MNTVSTEEVVIDATVVDDDHEPAVSTAIARRERRSEVIRPLDPDSLIQSFIDYQHLLPRLLSDSDYQDAGRGKRFVKKSGWRKIATAFDLDVQIVRSTVDRDDAGVPLRAEVWARAIAPSGRSMDGDGYCSLDEDRFSGPRGNKSKLENDLRATATTRAMNRAISGLVGMGEVSAEEIDAGSAQQGPAFGPAVNDAEAVSLRRAMGYVLGVDDKSPAIAHVLGKIEERSDGYVPLVAMKAIGLLAAAVKAAREAEWSDPEPPDDVDLPTLDDDAAMKEQ